jgi:hypothetical protein
MLQPDHCDKPPTAPCNREFCLFPQACGYLIIEKYKEENGGGMGKEKPAEAGLMRVKGYGAKSCRCCIPQWTHGKGN